MSEPQADYDTDAGPTPGPWVYPDDAESVKQAMEAPTVDTSSDCKLVAICHRIKTREGREYERRDEMDANARFIAAAGTAAHDLPDEYDSVGAVEVLPELVDIAHRIIADSRLGDAEAGMPDPKPPARALLIELRKTLEQARTD